MARIAGTAGEGAFHNVIQPGQITLTGNLTVSFATYNGNILRIDPGGAARDVTLPGPANFEGMELRILSAADAAETITVKNAAGSTLGTVEQNRVAWLVVLSGAWVFNYKQIVTLS